ncbi:MAG TPA: transketolase [Pseudogracilibacillus sp.]|nr:transketolase [Pseudogracilibacillus sp.]
MKGLNYMQVEQLSVQTIRTLSIDAIEKANSGHPGLPMGAAPMAYSLFTNFMNHNPKNAKWFNRDRFILSAGHGSMLLYSLLHLTGYDVTMDDLKEFRQWGSRTPGHPEVLDTDGVEATTGPLGQGVAMAVGMAMAEAHLAAKYNKDNFELIDHYTYSLVGDGDIMEGISHEAASLAGHLALDKLIVLYDSNDISLDGDLDRSFSDNTEDRFKAYGWQVIRVEDGNDMDEINRAIEQAKENKTQPTLIEIKTIIGYGSPNKSAKSASHGAPLGADEVLLTKEYYKWTFEEDFHVPDEVYKHFEEKVVEKGQDLEKEWNELFEQYKTEYPALAEELQLAIDNKLPENWEEALPSYEAGKDSLATRVASSDMINAISKTVPSLFGGSADLASSNNTMMKEETDFTKESYEGRNIWFGVREFAMGAALNGMALHGGLKVYGGTFFVFSDYVRPAIRLSAIMNAPVTYVFTHDSIAVGEDGPTHEPVEQLASLRAMPNLSVIRPADGNETNAAWRLALESTEQPTSLVLTRQGLDTIEGTKEAAYEGVKRGAYIISKENEKLDAIIIATGSEVNLALDAQTALAKDGVDVRVVSMPSWDRFEAQDPAYKEEVLPKNMTARVAVEMAASLGWERYVGFDGKVIAVDKFGASAKGDVVIEKYGFTVENVVQNVKQVIS